LPPCTENDWQCGSWSPCVNNQQSRSCTAATNCDARLGASQSVIQSCASQNKENKGNNLTVLILIIVVAILFLGVVVCVIMLLLRRKPPISENQMNWASQSSPSSFYEPKK